MVFYNLLRIISQPLVKILKVGTYQQVCGRYTDISLGQSEAQKSIRVLNQTFNELRLEKHPDKTLLGRTERGFDFLGYFIKPGKLSVSLKTIKNFLGRIVRLCEQGAGLVRIEQ